MVGVWGLIMKRRFSILDLLVVLAFLLGYFDIILNMLLYNRQVVFGLSDQGALIYYIGKASPLLTVFGVSSILTWMIYDGVDSPLWKWFPPFCFFFWCNRWQKWALVILLIVSTLIGMISGCF